MVEKIRHRDRLISVIIRAEHQPDGIEFHTPDDYSQQLACMRRPAGYVIAPHVHNEVPRNVVFTKETLFVRKGRARLDFYDDDRTYLRSTVLRTGDVVLLAFGGHGLEMLEETDIVEVKQGPYVGHEDKVRFEPIDSSALKLDDQ